MKKLLSVLLVILMLITALPLSVSAEGGSTAISTAEELLAFLESADNFENATVTLENDIIVNDGAFSLNDENKPMYNSTLTLPTVAPSMQSFKGTFDGNGYTISGLYTASGLFESCENATVKNVNLKNCLVYNENSADSVGALSSVGTNSTFENCKVDAIVVSNATNVGGALGKTTSCALKGIRNFGEVYSTNKRYVGGLVGYTDGGTVYECCNTGKITGFAVGGLIGYLDKTKLSSCFNTGEVTALAEAAGGLAYTIIPFDNGVIISDDGKIHNKPDFSITYCYNAGKINAEAPGEICVFYDGDIFEMQVVKFVADSIEAVDSYDMIESYYERYMIEFEAFLDDWNTADYMPLQRGFINTTEENIKVPTYGFCGDAGNENNGYPVLYNYHDHVWGEYTDNGDGTETAGCMCVGCSATDTVGTHKHIAGEWVITTPATCTEKGEEALYCADCNRIIETREINATGHSETERAVVLQPTCTKEGEEVVRCTVCKDVLETITIQPLEHDSEWIVNPATCVDHGDKYLYCRDCQKYVDYEAIPRLNHTDKEWQITIEPTCTELGEQKLYCNICKIYCETKDIPATGHKDGEWIVTVEPTYSSAGEKTCYCSTCNEQLKTQIIDKLSSKVTKVNIPESITLNYKEKTVISPNISVEGVPTYSVSYSTSDSKIATVNYKGEVTALGKGATKLTVTVTDEAGNKFIDTCEVKVSFTILQWILYIFGFGWLWM